MKLNKQHPLYAEDLQRILNVDGVASLRGKSVLVTGATGLVGVELVDALMQLGGVKVLAVGRSRQRAAGRLGEHYGHPDFTFIEQDVCDPLPDVKADYVIPLASNTHPLAYSSYPVETMTVNLKGAEHALRLAQACGAVVLYPSSVEIYGNTPDAHAFREDETGRLDLSTSRACYTESKRGCEALCQSFVTEHQVDVRIVRLSRVFGPTLLESDTKASSQFLLKALRKEDIVLKSDGGQQFSYMYVSDVVAAMLHVMLHGVPGRAYNVASDACQVQLKEFARLCAEHCGRQVVFDLPSEQERRGYSIARNALLDTFRLTETGFRPVFDMENAVRRTLAILSDAPGNHA